MILVFFSVLVVCCRAFIIGPSNVDCVSSSAHDTLFDNSIVYRNDDINALVGCDSFCKSSTKLDAIGFVEEPQNIYTTAVVVDNHGCYCHSACTTTTDFSQTNHVDSTNRQIIFRNDFSKGFAFSTYPQYQCKPDISVQVLNDTTRHAPEYCQNLCSSTDGCLYFQVSSSGCFLYNTCSKELATGYSVWKNIAEVTTFQPSFSPTTTSMRVTPQPSRSPVASEQLFVEYSSTTQTSGITAGVVFAISICLFLVGAVSILVYKMNR